MKKLLKEKWYLFSVWGVFFAIGMYWYVHGTVKAWILRIFYALDINIYMHITNFIDNDYRWIGYIFSLLYLAEKLFLFYVIGRLFFRDLSKKQIAASCTVYSVYALLTFGILILVYDLILKNDFLNSNSFLRNIMFNVCSLINIGINETDIGIAESTAFLILKTIFDGDEMERYHTVLQATLYIDLAVKFMCPYLFVFFGKSGKCRKLNSNEN